MAFVAEASIILFQKCPVIVYITISIKMLLKSWLLDGFWTAFAKASLISTKTEFGLLDFSLLLLTQTFMLFVKHQSEV